MPLVCTGRRIENDHPMVDVAVRYEKLVRHLVHHHVCGGAEILRVVAAFALPFAADLQGKFAIAGELQEMCVLLTTA